MTETGTVVGRPLPGPPTGSDRTGKSIGPRFGSWLPTWGLIATKHLELRKRRGLMAAVVLLTLALPVIVLGFRLLFHAVDPKSYGPAGSPSVFSGLCNPMAEFGFIAAAALGTSAGTTDLTDGVFRHLVITGRSRLALYLARIPAGLAILLPLVAVAFTMLCLVTSYEGTPQGDLGQRERRLRPRPVWTRPSSRSWLLATPRASGGTAFGNGPATDAAGGTAA